MVSSKGDTRAQRLPKETCRFGTDLKFADLASVKGTKWVNDFVTSVNGQLVVSTDRYIFQMAALEGMLKKGALVSLVLEPVVCSAALLVLLCDHVWLSIQDPFSVWSRWNWVLLVSSCFYMLSCLLLL